MKAQVLSETLNHDSVLTRLTAREISLHRCSLRYCLHSPSISSLQGLYMPSLVFRSQIQNQSRTDKQYRNKRHKPKNSKILLYCETFVK